MKTSTEINSNVKDTLLAVKTINTAEVSPFFKERVLQQIFNIPEEKASTSWTWFTPKIQFATLAGVLVLNILKKLPTIKTLICLLTLMVYQKTQQL